MFKTCRKCKQERSIDYFCIKSDNRDGRSTDCRLCRNAYMRDKRRLNPMYGNSKLHRDRLAETGYYKEYYRQNREKWLEKDAKRYASADGRARTLVNGARRRAEQKGWAFDLTVDFVRQKIEAGVCEATGLPLELLGRIKSTGRPSRSPSLDRKDNSKGYTMDNVWIVCDQYNRAKGEWDMSELVVLAEAILKASNRV